VAVAAGLLADAILDANPRFNESIKRKNWPWPVIKGRGGV
jgi:hypothetical protein